MTSRLVLFLSLCIVLLPGCDAFRADGEVRVIPYTGEPLSADQAQWVWEATVDETTILLVGYDDSATKLRVPTPPQYSPPAIYLEFEQGSGDLPRLTDAWIGRLDGGVGSGQESGFVAIETWEPQRLLSGVISLHKARSYSAERALDHIFWVDIPSLDALNGRD
ncbi:MAG: hypothetical protein AAGJ10_09155 [Bacteroidota bacterium]